MSEVESFIWVICRNHCDGQSSRAGHHLIQKKNDMKSLPASQYGKPSSRKNGLFPKSFPQ